MIEQEFVINVVTRMQDNGDGGYTTYFYNSDDELIANHPSTQVWNSETKKYDNIQLSKKRIEEILSGNNEYEDGYIDHKTIKVKIIEGVPVIEKFSIHAGQ